MSAIYRKRGAIVRYENGVIVRVTEAGQADEENDIFRCAPIDAEPLPLPSLPDIPRIDSERMIITAGVAEHQYGDITWREETLRFHASLTRGPLRVLVDRVEDLAPLAAALARAEQQEREAPTRLVLAPNVSAALLPSLAHLVNVWQSGGGRDGYGQPIEERLIEHAHNFYRPSYRMRPVRMPFNIRAAPFGAIDGDLPRAVAIIGPSRFLIEDRGRVYPAMVRVEAIAAVAELAIWYPYGAGSFGAEMML